MTPSFNSEKVKMLGVTISDTENNLLAFDLIDILNVIGDKVILSKWAVFDVEAVGNSAEELHRFSDRGETISGAKLLSISSDLIQIIDGLFEAYLDFEKSPWIVIRAVDSSEFDVETDDLDILDRIRMTFGEVTDIPDL